MTDKTVAPALGAAAADHFAGCAALEIRRKDDGPVLPLRGGGQKHELGIGEFHWDPPFGWRRRARRHHRSPALALSRRGRIPGAPRVPYRNTNSHALFAAEIQSFARENMALSAVSAVVSSSVGSNSFASCSGVRPARISSIICRLNSGA
jgi:hypothetical protein